jgi:hypothetical protein
MQKCLGSLNYHYERPLILSGFSYFLASIAGAAGSAHNHKDYVEFMIY